jgi:lambda family phage portal protein
MTEQKQKRTWFSKIWSPASKVTQIGNSIPDAGIAGLTRLDYDYAGATGAGPNAAMLSRLDVERARSRHEFMLNEYARRAKAIRTRYVVGSGLRPHIKGDAKLQELWKKFVKNSDPSGLLDFYDQQKLIYSEALEGGESMVLPRRRRPEDGLEVPLQLQVLEAEYLPSGRSVDMPANTIGGVELDKLERPVAYWLYTRHPADAVLTGIGLPELKRYEAARVIRILAPGRAGALRGRPIIAAVLPRLRAVEKYERADLAKKETAALMGVAVKMPAADDSVGDVLGLSAEEKEEGQTWELSGLNPGAIFGLPPGASIEVVNPQDSSTGFAEAWRTRYLGVAAGLDVPYHLLTGDHSGMNDRSLRSVMLDFFACVKEDRKRLSHQLNSRVWKEFLDAAERAGWKAPAGKTRSDFESVEWIGEPLPHIHPVQEVAAQTNAIRTGVKTLEEVLQENGSDLETFIEQKKRENEMLDEAEIILDCDPRKMTKAGGYQDTNTGSE